MFNKKKHSFKYDQLIPVQQNPFSWFNAADNRWVTNMWMLNIITQLKTFNTNSWEEQDLVFCVTWFVLETKTIVKTNP